MAMQTAGVILDVYDDPKGLVLREVLNGLELSEKLASSRLLEAHELERLPNRLFGLVATDHGEVLRKYAMHDPEHHTLSMLYFMKCGHILPEVVQIKVAANLVNACAWYDVDPPEDLVKTALLGAAFNTVMGGMELLGRNSANQARKAAQMGELRAAQTMGSKLASGLTVDLSSGDIGSSSPGHVAKALDKMNRVTTPGDPEEQLNLVSQTLDTDGSVKKADLTGTEIMPQSSLSGAVIRNSPTRKVALPSKTASWLWGGELSQHVVPVIEVEPEAPTHYALPHMERYPIDTPEQVKQAADYFNDNFTEFPLLERRVYAQALHIRAPEVGVKLSGRLLNYCGSEYGENIIPELIAREYSFAGTGHEEVYEVLREKISEIEPHVMAQLLREADEATGAYKTYGREGLGGFLDPYSAVYGVKLAEVEVPNSYTWQDKTDRVTGDVLEALSSAPAASKVLHCVFDRDMIESFKKDPIAIFKSLPDPQKVVVARLANQHASETTYRT